MGDPYRKSATVSVLTAQLTELIGTIVFFSDTPLPSICRRHTSKDPKGGRNRFSAQYVCIMRHTQSRDSGGGGCDRLLAICNRLMGYPALLARSLPEVEKNLFKTRASCGKKAM